MGTFDLQSMWLQMGPVPKAVVFVLLFMSIYAIAVGVERLIVFNKAKKTIQYIAQDNR